MSEESIDIQKDKTPIVPRSEHEKQSIQNRLKRIEGQVRGLQKMLDEDRYCIDVLVQISAVNSALKQVGFTMLERHAETCVSCAVKSGEGDDYIDELMKVIRQFSK